MSGAPALASLAAFRAGAGVVWACVPESEHAAVAAHAPELMVHGGLEPERVLELAARAGAVVAGPGLGRDPAAAALVDALVRRVEAPLVLDADALFALAGRLETLAGAARPDGADAARRRARAPARARQRARSPPRGSRACARRRSARAPRCCSRAPTRSSQRPASRCAWSRRPCRSSRRRAPATCSRAPSGALCARGLPPALALALAAVAHGSAARLAVSELGGIVAGDLLAAARATARVTRSTLEVDLAAVRANAGRLLAVAAGSQAVGGRQGGRLRARRGRVRRRRADGRGRARLLRDAGRGARAARGARRRGAASSCSRRSSRARRRTPAGFEIVVSSLEEYARLRASGVACAVHVKADTGMGRWGMAPAGRARDRARAGRGQRARCGWPA